MCADGGEVGDSAANEKEPHKIKQENPDGISYRGEWVRAGSQGPDKQAGAKMLAKNAIAAQRRMPPPKLKGLAHGGRVNMQEGGEADSSDSNESVMGKIGDWIDKKTGNSSSAQASPAPSPSPPPAPDPNKVKSMGFDTAFAKGGQVRDKLIDMVHRSMKSDGIEPGEANKQMAHEHAKRMGIDLKEHEAEHAASKYAEGGDVSADDQEGIDDERKDVLSQDFSPAKKDSADESFDKMKSKVDEIEGYDDGGKVEKELKDHEEDDEEIHSMLAKSLKDSLQGNDHKRIMDSIEACILACMAKNKE
jgi:hypothetical protein